MWTNMNYQSLVPFMRAMMTEEGRCQNCGHHFLNERDIHLEHREAPRFPKDFARLHARNIGLLCAACNGRKGHKPFTEWLDEQEEARQSNEANPSPFEFKGDGAQQFFTFG
jgi:5-methylcytosine-specific restriction endonuclease McrA